MKPGEKGGKTAFARVQRGSGGYTGGFMATMENGSMGIFRRKTSAKHPIEQLYGPGQAQMLEHQKVSERIQKEAVKRFDKQLDDAVNKLLPK